MPTTEQLENREKWFHDLETTEAKQGKRFLNLDGAFCCLGRACEVLNVRSFPPKYGASATEYEFSRLDGRRSSTVDERFFADTFGVSGNAALHIMEHAMSLNDSMGASFPVIALALRQLFSDADNNLPPWP